MSNIDPMTGGGELRLSLAGMNPANNKSSGKTGGIAFNPRGAKEVAQATKQTAANMTKITGSLKEQERALKKISIELKKREISAKKTGDKEKLRLINIEKMELSLKRQQIMFAKADEADAIRLQKKIKANEKLLSIQKKLTKELALAEKIARLTHARGATGKQRMANAADSATIFATNREIRNINLQQKAIQNRKSAYRGTQASIKSLNLELKKYQSLERAGISLDSKMAKALGLSERKYKAVAVAVANLNRQKSKLTAAGGGGTGGPMGGWGTRMAGGLSDRLSSMGSQAVYWGQLRLLYGVYNKVNQGIATFNELMRTTNRAVRTAVTDVNDLNQVMIAHEEIMDGATAYLSKHLGTISDYTEAVHQLTQAEMSRAEALKLAPNIMAAASGLDAPIKDISRLMVGLNEIFKDMDGYTTDSERINRMLSVMSLAVKKEVTTIADLRRALGYIGPVAKQANMSFEELVATVALLNTNLFQASRAGTGIRQMLNALSKHADKLKGLGVDVDMSKPLQFAKTMEQLGQSIGKGALSGEKMKEFLATFGLRGAAPAAIIAQQFESFAKSVRELRGAKLQDLLGMREIMENNVPAQMEILRKNVDLYVATVLRGAIGGRDMADSLKKINDNMQSIHSSGLVLGETIDSVFINKPALLIPFSLIVLKIASNIKTFSIQANAATIGIEGMTAGIATMQRTLMFTKLGILGVVAGIATLVFWMKKKEQQQNEAIKQSRESADKNREEAKSFRMKAKELRKIADEEGNLKLKSEQLAAAQKSVREAAAGVGEIFDKKLGTINSVADAYDRLADSSERYAKAQAARSLRLIREKYEKTKFTSASSMMGMRLSSNSKYLESTDKIEKIKYSELKKDYFKDSDKIKNFLDDIGKYIKTAKELGKENSVITASVKEMIRSQNFSGMLKTLAALAKANKDAESFNIFSSALDDLNASIKSITLSAEAAAKKLRKMSFDAITNANIAAWKLAAGSINAGLTPSTYKDKNGKTRLMTKNQRVRSMTNASLRGLKGQKMERYLRDSGTVEIVNKVRDMAGGDDEKFQRLMRALTGGVDSVYNDLKGGPDRKGFRNEQWQMFDAEQRELKNIVVKNKKFNTNEFMRSGLSGFLTNKFGKNAKRDVQYATDKLAGKQSETQKLLDASIDLSSKSQTLAEKLEKNVESTNTLAKTIEAAAGNKFIPGISKLRESMGYTIPLAPPMPTGNFPKPSSGAMAAFGGTPGFIVLNIDNHQFAKFAIDTTKKIQTIEIVNDIQDENLGKINRWSQASAQMKNTYRK